MAGRAEIEILLKARDQALRVMERTGKAGAKAGKLIEQNWKQATLVLAGAGVAIEALARKQAESTKTVERLGAQIGLTSAEVRDWAIDLANVTFPLEDVLALMELGVQQGIRSEKALTDYANFWDMVGDATGAAGPELAKVGVGLKAVGIAAGEEKKALAAFGFVTDNLTGTVADFLTFIDKTGPQLRIMGLGVNDVAAVLAAMEKELGLAGRTARSEFKEAIDQNEDSLEAALAQLGLNVDMLEKYRVQVEASSGVIERNAAIHERSFTPIQRLRHQVSELAFAHADVIKQAAQFAPLLIAAGPAAMGLTLAMNRLSMAMRVLRGALKFIRTTAVTTWAALFGPIGLGVLAIAGLVAAFFVFRDQIPKVFEVVGDAISWWFNNTYLRVINGVIRGLNQVARLVGKSIDTIDPIDLGDKFKSFGEKASAGADKVLSSLRALVPTFGRTKDAADDLRATTDGLVQDFDQKLPDAISRTTRSLDPKLAAAADSAGRALEVMGIPLVKTTSTLYDMSTAGGRADFALAKFQRGLEEMLPVATAAADAIDESAQATVRKIAADIEASISQARLTDAVRFFVAEGMTNIIDAFADGRIELEGFIGLSEDLIRIQRDGIQAAKDHAAALKEETAAAVVPLLGGGAVRMSSRTGPAAILNALPGAEAFSHRLSAARETGPGALASLLASLSVQQMNAARLLGFGGSGGGVNRTTIINNNGPIYSVLDFRQEVEQAVRDGALGGAFDGIKIGE